MILLPLRSFDDAIALMPRRLLFFDTYAALRAFISRLRRRALMPLLRC